MINGYVERLIQNLQFYSIYGFTRMCFLATCSMSALMNDTNYLLAKSSKQIHLKRGQSLVI